MGKIYDSFYKLLFQNETFVQMVKDRYKEVRPLLLEVFSDFEKNNYSNISKITDNILS